MKPIVIIVSAFLLVQGIFAQEREAKIIFLDSTSIKGYGEIKKDKIYFRVDQKSESTEWDSEMVSGIVFEGYGFSEEYEYVPIKNKKNPVLMEVIERGNVSLYKNPTYGYLSNLIINSNPSPNFQMNNDLKTFPNNGLINHNYRKFKETSKLSYTESYYVKRDNENVAINLADRFKKTAPEYFSDCPALLEKIKTKELDVDTIPDIVFYYNDYCNDYFDK